MMADILPKEARRAAALNRSIDIFEGRNRAMRILYDTLITIENMKREDVFQILCDNLRKIANASYATFSSYDDFDKKMIVEAVSQEGKDESFSDILGYEEYIDGNTYESIIDNKILKCSGMGCLVSSFFPSTITETLGCNGDNNCYQLSTMCDGKLLGVATVKMPKGQMLKLKDIIDSYLNMSGLILRRMNAETELKSSLEKLDKVNKLLTKQQAQIVQQEKMASIGQLVSGVAHEINNPLNYITGNLFVLNDYLNSFKYILDRKKELISALENNEIEKAKEIKKNIQEFKEENEYDYILEDCFDLVKECDEGAQRVAEIVVNLKSFARVNANKFDMYDINEGLKTTLGIVSNEVKYNCDLTTEFGDLGRIRCNINQLNQVFLNLIINAVHSMEGKFGKLEIKTKKEEDYVVITIKDNGCGIKEEEKERIFDPFFTTKEVGKGTGLGLSISHGIIEEHNGMIKVESEYKKGTTFKIYLPIVVDKDYC